MTRQMFWRSGAVHERMLAPSALSRKWWGMIGALGAVGATAYLLPSFVDGKLVTEGRRPEVADIELASNNANASSQTQLNPYSLPADKWHNVPLLALQSSTEGVVDGEVRLLALQAAYERERNSAAAAQVQVAALQEQLANLGEKQEEVLVLREQLADAVALKRQTIEPRIAETDQRKQAESALLRVVALQEELAGLHAQVLKAKATAESEKAIAASALAKLEAAQHQLASVTALQSDRTETESHLRSKENRVVDGPSLERPENPHAAELASVLPPPPEMSTASINEQEQAPLRAFRPGKSERATAKKPRQALLSIEVKPLARPANKTAASPVRIPETDALKLTKPRYEPRNQSVPPVGKPQQRASQQRRLLAQDTQNRRDSGALRLPSDLLPDSSLW